MLLFVVPARSPEPHKLPVGVAGPRPLRRCGRAATRSRSTYADADAARAAIREREVYGAIVPAEGRVLVASAASPVVAQQLRELARPAPRHGAVTWPAASGDPRGAA